MDFQLSDEHRMIRDTVREIAREKVAPRAAEIDEKEEYPEDIYQVYKQYGLLGLAFPEQYGGVGAGVLGLTIAVEEVAKYCCSSGLMLLLTWLPTAGIMIAGTEEQKQKYCGGVATGEMRGAFALTEPGAGSDAAAISTSARRKGDAYVLNGTKQFTTGTTVADFFVVAAKTDPAAGSRGMSVFVVERGTPGLEIGRHERKMGVRGVPTTQVILEECPVPASNMLGGENRGFRIVMMNLNAVRPLVAARGIGLAQGVLQYATDYARTRETFGRPLIQHQVIQFMLAELAMRIEAARLLTYQAAWMVDQGKVGKEAAPYLSMAKAFATETAVKASEDALQVLGGNGYMKEFATERHYRDAKQLTIVEGTSQVQRMIIARALVDGDLHYL